MPDLVPNPPQFLAEFSSAINGHEFVLIQRGEFIHIILHGDPPFHNGIIEKFCKYCTTVHCVAFSYGHYYLCEYYNESPNQSCCYADMK